MNNETKHNGAEASANKQNVKDQAPALEAGELTGGDPRRLPASACSASLDWSWIPEGWDHVKEELEAIRADSVTIDFFRRNLNGYYPGWPTQMQHCRELQKLNSDSECLSCICPACQSLPNVRIESRQERGHTLDMEKSS